MDIVEFFKTANRLCKNRTSGKCPIWKNGTCMNDFGDDSAKSIEETISKVEQWAKDNPIQEWIEAPDEGADGSWEACSRCAWESRWAASKYKYCLHCGARMVELK